MGRLIFSFLVVLSCLPAQQKKRIAVMNFDYATVQSNISAIFGTRQDVGKGMADLIVDRLVSSGVYSVVERKEIAKILAEQDFSNSDRVDANTAAKLGRILGVDAIVMGSITQFGRDDRTTKVGGGVLGGITGKYGIGGAGKKESKAVVAISARLVSTDTAEILAVASGRGESTRSGIALLGSGGSSDIEAGGAYDMRSSNFANTILGEAVSKAVTEMARQLDAEASRIPARAVKLSGLVADVSGQTLVLNVGSRAGVKKGDRLEVWREGREIRDPATGRVIKRTGDQLGYVVITEVDDLSSTGTFNGNTTPKVGDAVRTGQ
jgi:curli biogenesis system outer membrane secretion channel CsgG